MNQSCWCEYLCVVWTIQYDVNEAYGVNKYPMVWTTSLWCEQATHVTIYFRFGVITQVVVWSHICIETRFYSYPVGVITLSVGVIIPPVWCDHYSCFVLMVLSSFESVDCRGRENIMCVCVCVCVRARGYTRKETMFSCWSPVNLSNTSGGLLACDVVFTMVIRY